GAQVALSVALLAGAALLIASFTRLTRQDLGFAPDHLWVGFITLPPARYGDLEARQRFVDRTLDALRTLPGLERASVSDDVPLLGGGRTLYARADAEVPPVDKRASAPGHDIAPGVLRTWGVPVLSGRDFDETDAADRPNGLLLRQAGREKALP